MLEKYGLASSSGANAHQSGLNLTKMTEDIQMNMRSSPKLKNSHPSTFKLRIDTFENKIRVKRKDTSKLDSNSRNNFQY